MDNKLNHYLEHWALTDAQLLAQTHTSHIYAVTAGDERVILKLLNALGAREEAQGAIALRAWNGCGAVRLLREDAGAHLLEYASGEDARALALRGEDDAATTIIVGVLNQLHATPPPATPHGLTILRDYYRSLFQKAASDEAAGADTVYVRAARVAEDLLSNPMDVCLLHGDMHHENVRHHSQRGWLAFDPKGVVGERAFDAANVLCNPYGAPDLVRNEARLLRQASILAEGLRIPFGQVLAYTFAYTALSASWHLEDGNHPEHELAILAIIEPHLKR